MNEQLTLRQFDRDAYLSDPARKQQYVNAVFDTVAGSYDRFTRLCSIGMDAGWKRELVRLLKSRLAPHHQILDLASGTGDLTFALARQVPRGKVIGLDISRPMVALAEEARRARHAGNVEFRVGDLMATGFADSSLDAVTVSYGLRNCPDYRLALAEIHRVLKPGACLASLDFVRPDDPLFRFLFIQSLLTTCRFYGWLWHGEPEVYGYLAHSIAYHASNREFRGALADAGFEVIGERPKLFGAIYLHLARKR
jgi:demethylmenaquinone methyltransferase/2-methoxy-6-polyprenyl-1,4-benzoquinol methylase